MAEPETMDEADGADLENKGMASSENTHHPENAHFLEYVRLEIENDPLAGLQLWSERFTQYRNEGRLELCQALLQGAKGFALPLYGRATVRYAEGWLTDRMGRWQEAISAYQACLQDFHAVGILALDVEIGNNIGSLYQDQGLWTEARQAYEAALAAAAMEPDQKARGLILNNLGNLWLVQGDAGKALAAYEEAIELLRAAGDRYNAASALLGAGNAHRERGEGGEAQGLILDALLEFLALDRKREVGTAMLSLALLYQVQGKLMEALIQYEQALPILRDGGGQINVIKTLGNMAVVHERRGNPAEARRLTERALEGYRDLQDVHGEALMLVNLARLSQRLREETTADSYAAEARVLAERFGFADLGERLNALGL